MRKYAPPSTPNIKWSTTARTTNLAKRNYAVLGSNVWNFKALLYGAVM